MIHISGGKLTATGKAIDIGGDAAVEVSGTTVIGAVETGGHAHLVGIAPQKRTGSITGNDTTAWQKAACDGIPECFTMTAANGPVDVEVTAHIGKDGHVEKVALEGTTAPATAACIRNISLEKKILNYDGGSGALVCTLSGTQTPGAQMLSVHQAFVR